MSTTAALPLATTLMFHLSHTFKCTAKGTHKTQLYKTIQIRSLWIAKSQCQCVKNMFFNHSQCSRQHSTGHLSTVNSFHWSITALLVNWSATEYGGDHKWSGSASMALPQTMWTSESQQRCYIRNFLLSIMDILLITQSLLRTNLRLTLILSVQSRFVPYRTQTYGILLSS